MVYKLYIETVKQENTVAWSFMFYNHQNFNVYKRCGKVTDRSEESVILETLKTALDYFDGSIRRRYYDEHFSTRIDEDYVTAYTHFRQITETAETCKEACAIGFLGEDKVLWESLLVHFTCPTMMFEDALDERFISQGKELAKSVLQ